ncbi:MAG TPA: FAD-dependent oxidoreductase, partial [Acidimicrobiia bacterium]|nr:FAD-dependent oxidoreductase [Acidimicrobiia bacterium]
MKITVIGGGIAGVAAGYYLAISGQEVTLLEQERTLAYHATGRSAALYFENYGATPNRPLTRASLPFFESPPPGLADQPLLAPRGALWVGREDQMASLQRAMASGDRATRWLTPQDARRLVPGLRPDYVAGAVWEPQALDLDVAALHQAFVRGMRQAGATILTSTQVTALSHRHGRWMIHAGTVVLTADVVVNAAGAWCDVVGGMAGAARIGLEPRRRTAFMVPGDSEYARWPLVADIDNEFYFRPDGIQVLCSLADETPVEPGDARPD